MGKFNNINWVPYSPQTLNLCVVNCIIQDLVYDVQVAALYVPPFCPTVGWYDWVNEATFKHAHEVCVKSLLRSLLCLHGFHGCEPWDMKLWTMRWRNAEKRWRCLRMNQQGISQKQIAETLGRSRCAGRGLLDHHRGNGDVSYLPSSCRPSVPTLPLDRFGNLYATVSGTEPGLG